MGEVQKEEIVSVSHTTSSEPYRFELTKFSSPKHEEVRLLYKPQMLEKERARAQTHTHTQTHTNTHTHTHTHTRILLSITNKMQRLQYSLLLSMLYMFQAVSPPVIRSSKTVHTAPGICQACLLLPLAVAARKLGIYPMLYSF